MPRSLAEPSGGETVSSPSLARMPPVLLHLFGLAYRTLGRLRSDRRLLNPTVRYRPTADVRQ